AFVEQDGTVSPQDGFPVNAGVHDQTYPDVASLGGDFFIAWEDFRSYPPSTDIYGTPVSRDGVVGSPAGLPISTALDSQRRPKLSGLGQEYFVAYLSRHISPAYDVFGARVNTSGQVLAADLPICLNSAAQMSCDVANDGVDYFVVWHDARNGGSNFDIYG